MKLPAGSTATLGFLLAITALIVTSGLSLFNIRVIAENQGWVSHTQAVISSLRNLEARLTRAESAQRGFIISKNPIYRDSAREIIRSVPALEDELKSLIADNAVQRERFDALNVAIRERLVTLEQGVSILESGNEQAMVEFIALNKGGTQMRAINDKIAAMEATEQELLRQRAAESERSLNATLGLLAVTTLLGLGLVGLAYILTVREVGTRLRAAEDLKRANEELEIRVEERTADLNEAAESLRRSNRELEQFASVASHDLQEPLRKIQAFGDRLQEKCAPQLGEQGQQYVERMQASAVRMRNLIDSLLNYSRVTTKAKPFAPVDLAEVAREVVSDLEGRIKQTGGRVDLGPLPTIDADAMQMRQLLQNLIANGLKFSRPGETPIVKVDSRILASDGDGAGSCEIAISDNGIGFEEIYLDRIFDVFQRLHGRQEYGGTGMGLAICRRIVERHGGTITAKSEPDKGATFLVTVPVKQSKEESSGE
jgi:signal transduction histidine kinase